MHDVDAVCTPAHSDEVLAPVSARFSLGAAYEDLPFSDAPPSGIATRPFTLRVAGGPAQRRARRLPAARYCPQRQIAVSDDLHAEPIHPMGFEKTTLGSKDGEGNPMEDWTPDR